MLAPVHRSLFLHPPPPPYAVCPGTFSKCHQKPAMLATGHRARFLRGTNRSRRHGRRRDLTGGMGKPTGCGTDEVVLASQQQRPAASARHPALCPRPLGHHPGGPHVQGGVRTQERERKAPTAPWASASSLLSSVRGARPRHSQRCARNGARPRRPLAASEQEPPAQAGQAQPSRRAAQPRHSLRAAGGHCSHW